MVTFNIYLLTMEGQTTTDFYALFARPAIEYEKSYFIHVRRLGSVITRYRYPCHVIKLIAEILKRILC